MNIVVTLTTTALRLHCYLFFHQNKIQLAPEVITARVVNFLLSGLKFRTIKGHQLATNELRICHATYFCTNVIVTRLGNYVPTRVPIL